MEFILASTIGTLIGSGMYLILHLQTFTIIMGLSLWSYAINIFLFSISSLNFNMEAILHDEIIKYTDPLPQALVLTAIVISFAMTAMIIVLAIRTYIAVGSDDIEKQIK